MELLSKVYYNSSMPKFMTHTNRVNLLTQLQIHCTSIAKAGAEILRKDKQSILW